jgi:hypothetical protein
VLLVGLCQDQEECQERNREAIVETGFDVQCLAHLNRDPRVIHHRLAQCCVRGREHGAHDGGLPDGEIGEQQRRYYGPQRYGERHSYPQEAQWQCLVLSQCGEVGPRGVGEQHEREGDFAEQQHGVIVEPHLDQAEASRTQNGAGQNEDDRRREYRAFQPPRNDPESEHDAGQHHEINHRILRQSRSSQDYANHARAPPSAESIRKRNNRDGDKGGDEALAG